MMRVLIVLGVVAVAFAAGPIGAADCNGNEVDDAADMASGASADCNGNGVPDECDVARRWEPGERAFLGASCMFFMAWSRDTPIISADLDGDVLPDLATANCSSDSVSVFPSWGNRMYGWELLLPVGDTPIDIAAADLDGDGDLDLATADYGSNDASVLLNRGDGTFEASRPFPGSTTYTTSIAVADLSGDGRVDLALSGSESIALLRNSGGGSFAWWAAIPTWMGGQQFYPKNLEAADLDGDSDPDLIAGDREVYLWRNGGGGSFTGPSSYPLTGGNPGVCWTHTILPVDVTGDGRPDIVTADYTDGGTPSVSVLRNAGNFAFTGPTPYFFQFNDECQYATAGDLDGDGDTDLVAVGGDRVAFLENGGGGTFSGPEYMEIGYRTSVALADDIDLDGDPDLLVKRWVDESRWIEVIGNSATSFDADGNGIPDECAPPPGYLVGLHDEWTFFRGRTAPPAGWSGTAFDDSGWERGPTGIGYGDGDDLTVLDDMQGSYRAVFCRKVFDVADPAAVRSLTFRIDCDDGFVAYLNGLEVARSNMPNSPVAFDAPALSAKEPGEAETFDLSATIGSLVEGPNMLAVEVHNVSLQSSDLTFIPALLAEVAPSELPALSVTSGSAEPGSTGGVMVLLSSDEPVQAFSFGIAHDPSVAVLEAIDIAGCLAMAALNGGSGPEFFDFDLDAGTAGCGPGTAAGGTVYAVANLADPSGAIPAGSDIPVVRFLYRAAPGVVPGMVSPLAFTGCLGDFRPWSAVITIGNASRIPRISSGALTIVEGKPFLRGDSNGDGAQDISDVVTVLSYLFGDHILECGTAADANDDGNVDISDAIRLLFFLFSGPDPLPEPGAACGADPTADGLSCGRFPACP
jgi:hypothetical protein